MAAILRRAAVAAAALLASAAVCAQGASTFYSSDPNLGSARVVFQTNYGDIEFGFFPHVAPKTVEHIFKLVRLGCYNTNHIFRVDKGFVAQVAAVMGGRSTPMNEEQKRVAEKTIVGEFSSVKHVRGILSMGRHSDPDSGGSSFSFLLGDAPHLDGQYAVFGRVTKGDDTLRKLERLPTRREGIFVMPIERIDILSTYYYGKADPLLRDVLKILIWRTAKQKNLFLGGDFLNQHQKLSDGEENALLDAGVLAGIIPIQGELNLMAEAEYGPHGK